MQLVERHIILDTRFEAICHKSALLYNFVTYHYRQAIFGKQAYFGEYELYGLCAECNQEDYRALPAQTAQQVISQVFKAFKSWREAKKEYEENPNKYKGKPKLPGYKKGNKQNIVVFTNQQAKLKEGFIHFPKLADLAPFKTKVSNFQQVRITPQANCYVVEVVYNATEMDLKLEKGNVLAIDLGINNIATSINNVGIAPFIVNGKIMKSFNHWYNKSKAKLMSFIGDKGKSNKIDGITHYRNCYIEDKIHKTSRFIIDYCIEHNIGTIVIGKNDGWKQEINLGKKTNQKFVEIPHAKLIQKIQYKAKMVGIEVKLTEESYTSKIDHLALEPMKKQENYLGKRVERGLFQSSTGKLINADINGAIGIGRKVFGDSFVEKIINSGCAFQPYRINIL